MHDMFEQSWPVLQEAIQSLKSTHIFCIFEELLIEFYLFYLKEDYWSQNTEL